jgi:glycosidase
MKRKSLSLLSSILLISSLASCNKTSDSQNGPSASVSADDGTLVEDMRAENIVDDNCRNYYEIFVYSFADGNKDGHGDLKGITSKLDYIKESGYNGIWLTPIFTSNTTHKYNAYNYYEIDKMFGDMDDLKTLVKTAHEKGIRVILDLVMNHCSRQNPLYQKWLAALKKSLGGEVLTEEEKAYKELFSYTLEKPASNVADHYKDIEKYNQQNIYVESNFDRDMPEFNFDSDLAKQTFKDIISYYLKDIDVDGFRLDAVKYMYYGDTVKNCEILKYFHDYATSIKEDAYMVGEDWESASFIESYYKDSGLDSLFFFPGAGVGEGSMNRSINMNGRYQEFFFDLAKELVSKAHGKIPAPFLDNHDMSRVARSNQNQTKFLNGLLSVLNGATFTYYGDEIGLMGNTSKGDSYVRTRFYWGDTSLAMCKNPGDIPSDDTNGCLEDQMADADSIYNYTKHAMAIRNSQPGIARGEILDSSDMYDDFEEDKFHYTILNKKYDNKQVSIIINFNEEASCDVDISNLGVNHVAGLLTAVKGTKFTKASENVINVPAYGIAVLD